MVLQKGTVEIFTSNLEEKIGDVIKRVEGVQDVAGELADIMALETEITTLAVELAVRLSSVGNRTAHRRTASYREQRDVVLLGQSAAEVLKKKVDNPTF